MHDRICENSDRYTFSGRFKIFHPDFYHGAGELKDMDTWFGGEVTQCINILRGNGVMMLRGELGQGKSEITYNIAERRESSGKKSMRYEGHNVTFPPKKIESLFLWAVRNDALLVWDSFDYIVLGSRKAGRKLSLPQFIERTDAIFKLVDVYTPLFAALPSGGLILTCHDDLWLSRRSLQNENRNYFLQITDLNTRIPIHEVKALFQSSEFVRQYYEVFFTEDIIESDLLQFIINAAWDDAYLDWFLRNYNMELIFEDLFQDKRYTNLEISEGIQPPLEIRALLSRNWRSYAHCFLEELRSFRLHKLLIADLKYSELFIPSSSDRSAMFQLLTQKLFDQQRFRILKSFFS